VPHVPQLGESPGLDGAAGTDHRHPVADSLHLGEQMAGEQHRPARLALLGDARPELGLHERVEPAGGLVHDQQLGSEANAATSATF
jgi:hypothetical protein